MNTLVLFAQSLGYVGVVTAFLWMAKIISDITVAKHFDANDMIEEQNNNAVAFRRGGLYLGTAIGMFGALQGASKGFTNDMIMLCLDGVLVMFFMLISRRINDWFVIHGINNNKAVKEGNSAVGAVEAGSYIATGIIAYASVSGEGGPMGSGLIYFALGQVVLLLMVVLHEKLAPYAVVKNIREGNLAAGVMLASTMVAFSLVLKGAIAGPFNGWATDLTGFAVSTVAGLIMVLLIFNKLVGSLFLKGTDIKTEIERDHNVAAIVVLSSVKIALAFVISAVII